MNKYALVIDDIAYPSHPYLLNIWKKAMAMFPFLTSFEFTELGYGVALSPFGRANSA